MRRLFSRKKRGPIEFVMAPPPRGAIDYASIADERNPELLKEPVVITFGTRDGVYDKFAERLAKSCENCGQESLIETIPACGRENACFYKPTFIKSRLLALGRPVLWLDADSEILEKISMPKGKWDLAVLKNQRNKKNPFSSQVTMYQPTIGALRFLELWEQFCSAHWLKPGLDHRKFNYTMEVLEGYYISTDIAPYVTGKIIGDSERKKQVKL